MGKGDKKTRKGKIIKGTFGNSRPRKAKAVSQKANPKKKTKKKTKAKKK